MAVYFDSKPQQNRSATTNFLSIKKKIKVRNRLEFFFSWSDRQAVKQKDATEHFVIYPNSHFLN